MYIGFNTRDIIYECKCGKRTIKRVTRGFSDSFPIQTEYGPLTRKEFLKLLNEK